MTRSTAELRQYLAGEWLFNNDFKDTSGNGNDGTPTNIEWKPTLRGMKPRFNGSSSTVGYGNDISLNMTNQISYGGWVSFNDDLAGVNRFFIKGSAETQYEFYHSSPYAITSVIVTSDTPAGIYTIVGTLNPRTWYHIFCTYDGSNVRTYINGIQQNITAGTGAISTNAGQLEIGNTLIGMFDYAHIYNTALTAAEVLNLYNETRDEYGVMPAEHSFTHNPDDVIDPSGAVGAWGTTKESTNELSDLSGNGNVADIYGAMPTEGFIQGRRFTAANSNYLDCGNDISLKNNTGVFYSIFKTSEAQHTFGGRTFELGSLTNRIGIHIWSDNKLHIFTKVNGITTVNIISENDMNDGTVHTVKVVYGTDGTSVYIDGLFFNKNESDGTLTLNGDAFTYIGRGADIPREFEGDILFTMSSVNDFIDPFNTLARLPFWSVNYTDYPDNGAEYTDNLPYSSSIISSGTFKVDDDKLQCVSAGTMTYSASYEFDGSEYIKVEIDGVEYAGTGTITQGNTTVSVAQGSNKITIVMGTGDTIDGDGIDIQFREEV